MRNVRELDQNDIEMAIRQYVADNSYIADHVTLKITPAYNGNSHDSSPASVSATVVLADKPIDPIRAQWGDEH